MSEEHKCTEECIGQLEDIVERLQEEHQEDLACIVQLEEEVADERVENILQTKHIVQLEEALRFYADRENYVVDRSLGTVDSEVADDEGATARAALSPSEPPQEKEE